MLSEPGQLVDADRGLISRRIFIDPDIYRAGAGAGVWTLLAVPVPRKPAPAARRLLLHLHGRGPGAGHPRGEWQVRAFLNVCRHRDMTGCAVRTTGNTEPFTCSYHGWTYRNDGRLVGVPYLNEAYHGELNRCGDRDHRGTFLCPADELVLLSIVVVPLASSGRLMTVAAAPTDSANAITAPPWIVCPAAYRDPAAPASGPRRDLARLRRTSRP